MKINNQIQTSLNIKDQFQKAACQKKDITYIYRLVGTVIQVIRCVDGVEVGIMKSVPVERAPASMIAKLENVTMVDLIMIEELRQSSDENLPEEIQAYMKHESYE